MGLIKFFKKQTDEYVKLNKFTELTEYDLEDVTFAYLALLDKLSAVSDGNTSYDIVTDDVFTDKAIQAYTQVKDYATIYARIQDYQNKYRAGLVQSASSADHFIKKIENGSATDLATESVDIDTSGELLCLSCSGSTIKSLRYVLTTVTKKISDVTPDATISATDTTFTSGHFGVREIRETTSYGFVNVLTARLLPPQTELPRQSLVIESEVIGKGTEEDPKRPEIFDEIKFTYGAFDYKDENTMIITTNETDTRKIEQIKEYCRKKNLMCETVKHDKDAVIELYEKIVKEHGEKIAGKDNFLYQVSGKREYELLQNADFYHGFVEGHYDMKDIERVNPAYLERRINTLKSEIERLKITKNEKDKHIQKLKEFMKK